VVDSSFFEASEFGEQFGNVVLMYANALITTDSTTSSGLFVSKMTDLATKGRILAGVGDKVVDGHADFVDVDECGQFGGHG
jgi:hypothetical protein